MNDLALSIDIEPSFGHLFRTNLGNAGICNTMAAALRYLQGFLFPCSHTKIRRL